MEIKERVQRAFRRVIADDAFLLTADANERSITHRMAIYLEKEFPSYNVDCEYNRKGLDPKRLPTFGMDRRLENDGINLYPDIIVHHRGTENNLLAIEAKPSTKTVDCLKPQGCKCDRCKLLAYRADLKYRHTFYVIFPVGAALEQYTDARLADYVQEIQ